MTGEMYKPKNADKGERYWKGKLTNYGFNPIGNENILIRPNYPEFFDLADEIKKKTHEEAIVKPFDVYAGPYISVPKLHLKFWLDEGFWGERHRYTGSEKDYIPIGDASDVVKFVKAKKMNYVLGEEAKKKQKLHA
ncbi:MAG: hypothetical protein QXL94_00960 [Candidatus Parvarchaeum sp.]